MSDRYWGGWVGSVIGNHIHTALLAVLVVLQYVIIIGLVISGYFSPALLHNMLFGVVLVIALLVETLVKVF